jgi:hypothetical protein
MTGEQAELEAIAIIDVDSHVTEPPDLWTSRVSVAKWGDRVPHVRANPVDGEQCWYVGDTRLMGVASSASFPAPHRPLMSSTARSTPPFGSRAICGSSTALLTT